MASEASRRLFVGFLAGICRVPCRVFRATRHGSALWNQWLISEMSGLSGSHKRREPQRFQPRILAALALAISSAFFQARACPPGGYLPQAGENAGGVRIGGCARSRRPFWTPGGLQTEALGRSSVCKSLGNLVGPPRFELGTS